jgi:hypothetical protein
MDISAYLNIDIVCCLKIHMLIAKVYHTSEKKSIAISQ